tara:strand:- start:533 stop:1072 length:540 start_codon:yes stop_codon:yes gene_type:complete
MPSFKLLFVVLFPLFLTGCGGLSKVDARKNPVNVTERAEKNIQQGKGFRFSDISKNSGVFDFATSNEMWRASIDLLDFTPLSNVDYSGGIVITDWFAKDDSKNEYLKITIRFLSNEIRADGLKVLIHKKTCTKNNVCSIGKVETKLSQEIKAAILREATLIKEDELVVDKNFKISGKND